MTLGANFFPAKTARKTGSGGTIISGFTTQDVDTRFT
jgi:hypothetical protein